jgi:hypothetical protein
MCQSKRIVFIDIYELRSPISDRENVVSSLVALKKSLISEQEVHSVEVFANARLETDWYMQVRFVNDSEETSISVLDVQIDFYLQELGAVYHITWRKVDD